MRGGPAEGGLILRDGAGRERRVRLRPIQAGSTDLVAAVPEGDWALAGLRLTPKTKGTLRLTGIDAEIGVDTGVYAVARTGKGNGLLEVYSLGDRPTRITVTSGESAEESMAALDLAPHGKASFPLPSGTALTDSATVHWEGGKRPVYRW
jgi:hypothetical protein